MKLKYFFLFSLFLGSTSLSRAQQNDNLIKRIIKKVFSEEKKGDRGNSFIALPAVAYAQETGLEIGIASTYNFYVDKNDLNNKTSNISLIGTITTEKQKKINITSDIWTKNNEYHIITDLRARDWPFNFYGIGNDTWQINEDLVDQTLYRVKLDVEKKISQKTYLGINANYSNYKFKAKEEGGIYEDPTLIGRDGGEFLALGVSALFDSRDVTTYSSTGLYARIKYSYAPNFFGKDNFVGFQSEVDIKGFYPIRQNLILAAQGIFRGTHGKNIPYYVKKDLGGDMSMRGYYLGRYRDDNYLTAQAELRYRFHPRFAAIGLLAAGTTFSSEQSSRFVPSYGFGGRYFFSLEHKASIRIDYAFGEKRPGEKRQSGFYLSLSEAF